MRLWTNSVSTNPRRVSVYLAEKGIAIDRVDMDMATLDHRQPNFLRLNPAGKVPVLELDNGQALTESAAIIEYLEELHPEPPMIGTGPEARARVRADDRIVADLIAWMSVLVQHANPLFASRVAQVPAVAVAMRSYVDGQLDQLELRLGNSPFLSDARPSIADCSLFALCQTCRDRLSLTLTDKHPGLDGWFLRFSARPSARP